MPKIDIRFMPGKTSQIRNIGVSKLCFDSKSRAFALRSICGFLGSFDPLHKGHEWIVDKLLERFDAVLLLIPAFHFEKTVRFPLNATFEQRVEMLATFSKRKGERIAVGLTHEVLFIRLADCLNQYFPSVEIAFGMGNETFEKVLASENYYARLGLPWTAEEQDKLERLKKRVVVFGRSSNNDQFITVPEALRQISSTQVREIVMELRQAGVSEATWRARLGNLISPEIFRFILREKLYSSVRSVINN
jgi:cytidyltransferase-like protein